MKEIKDLSLANRLINHGPVVLISAQVGEKTALTPIAWIMPVSKKPPRLILESNARHFVSAAIIQAKQFIVSIPGKNLLPLVEDCGKVSGHKIDKFKKFYVEQSKGKTTHIPYPKDCLAYIECKLIENKNLLDMNLFLGEIIHAEAQEEAFSDHWLFEQEEFKTIHHLGADYFSFPQNSL